MRISEVVGITGARLINEPFISAITHLRFSLDKLSRGDLFIAKNTKDIKQAVKKGAFGILFEGECVPIDEEIAWLQSDSLEQACAAFVRYLLVEWGIKIVTLSKIELEIVQAIVDSKQALFATDSMVSLLECLSSVDWKMDTPQKMLYIFGTRDFAQRLNLDPAPILCLETLKLTLLSQSLLQMKIMLDDQMYALPIPGVFFDTLQELIKILRSLQITFDLHQMRSLEGLKVYYFDSEGYLRHRESSKVLIILEDFQLFKQFAIYLEKHTKWAKKCYFLPEKSEKFSTRGRVSYQDSEDAIKKLRQKFYHFALFYAHQQEACNIISALLKPEASMTLLGDHDI